MSGSPELGPYCHTVPGDYYVNQRQWWQSAGFTDSDLHHSNCNTWQSAPSKSYFSSRGCNNTNYIWKVPANRNIANDFLIIYYKTVDDFVFSFQIYCSDLKEEQCAVRERWLKVTPTRSFWTICFSYKTYNLYLASNKG